MLSCDINSPYFGQFLATIANENQRLHNERMAQARNGNCLPPWERPEAHRPDAQLISQSPRMLACLEAIRTAYDNAARHGHSIPSELVRAIGESAAITAKAKGWTA